MKKEMKNSISSVLRPQHMCKRRYKKICFEGKDHGLSCIAEAVYDFPHSQSYTRVTSNDTAVDSDKNITEVIVILYRFQLVEM